MKHRFFTKEFKQQIVQQMINGVSVTQLSREHQIHQVILYRWKKAYQQGKLNGNGINIPMDSETRIKELERIVGRLTADNELLKKAVQMANSPSPTNACLSGPLDVTLSRGGVK